MEWFVWYYYNMEFDKKRIKTVLKEQRKFFQNQSLGIEREILNEIDKLTEVPHIVVITGLRRVGKSVLLLQIARKFYDDNYYYVNFEDETFLDFEAKDFKELHKTLIELYGTNKVFFLDEVQNIKGWERFVRRLHDEGYKFFITGSNASLLSQELGTKITGRYLQVNLFPFSFTEYLSMKEYKVEEVLTTVEEGLLLKHFDEYLKTGGIPDAVIYPKVNIHETLYENILFKDIVSRYSIDAIKEFEQLSYYLISNLCSSLSYNKIKGRLKLGSVSTVSKYIKYLENSWLFFINNVYDYSVKRQQVAPKKVYSIDTGLANSVGFSFSENKGHLLENLVYIELKRRNKEVYYYKTEGGYEVDFYTPDDNSLYQVSYNAYEKEVVEREKRALIKTAEELGSVENLYLLTSFKEGDLNDQIKTVPVYKWLLGS